MSEHKHKKLRTHSFKNLRRVLGNKESALQAIICLFGSLFVFVSAYVVLHLAPLETHAIALFLCFIAALLMLTPKFGDAIELVVRAGSEVPKNEYFFPLAAKLDLVYQGVIFPIPVKPPRNAPRSTI